MALLAKCLVLALSAVLLSVLCGGASAMGLPPPPPQDKVKFSIAVQGMVWCSTCKYSGYYAPMNASPLEGTFPLIH